MAAFASVSTAQVAAPVSVLYWDGSSLNVIGPTSGYVIPAGATYAIDEAGGTGLILAAMPGTAAPDPNTVPGQNASVPSITTPSGFTFQIPNAANILSIGTSDFAGGSVKVTYNDGSTAETPGTYLPPGSPLAPSAPAQQLQGTDFPEPDPQLVVPIQFALLNDAWVQDFLGGVLAGANLPPDSDLKNNLFKGTVQLHSEEMGQAVLVDFENMPEPTTLTLTLLGLGLAAASLRIRRRCA